MAARYSEITITIGPTLKVGESFIKASVTLTAQSSDGNVIADLEADAQRLYARVALAELDIARKLNNSTYDEAKGVLLRMAGSQSVGKREVKS